MLIGNNYADNKIYRGIRHYDSLPLLSEDLHEYSDTIYMKNAYLMNNIIGYGTLNTPTMTISSGGVRLNEPSVVLIDGDISLIQSDDNIPIVTTEEIRAASYTSGAICIVGWYQHIDASSVLRNYGGVRNSSLPNDLENDKLGFQVSTRYQFRWLPLLLNKSSIESESITFTLEARDKDGKIIEGQYRVTSSNKSGDMFIATKPVEMDYAVSDLYIIPIAKYEYSTASSDISSVSAYLPVKPKGSSGFIKSESEPLGEYIEGTTWYNPITREFKTYVVGEGFVDSAATMGFLQYQSVYTIAENSQDITIPISISELQEGDILQVLYEGLVLVPGENYTIDYTHNTIDLLDFTVAVGERVTFTVTKIVEANDITTMATEFSSHISSIGSGTIRAHVSLSDSPNSTLGVSSGVAATPKAVEEAKIIKDSQANKNYKFGITNGLIYLEEV